MALVRLSVALSLQKSRSGVLCEAVIQLALKLGGPNNGRKVSRVPFSGRN